jgi:hypothetical protein
VDAGLPAVDAGVDAGQVADAGPTDAGVDGGTDAGIDAGIDAGSDADAGIDAGSDAGIDAGFDAGPSLEIDAGPANALITIDPTRPGLTVPDDFLGLSVEWNHIPDYLGDNAGSPRASVVRLLNNLSIDGHHPVLRIGGNSEDKAFWNPSGAALPSGTTVSIDATHLSILSSLHASTGSTFILGLNLNHTDATNAAALVTASLAALGSGSVNAFELGNEPDLYVLNGFRPLWYSPPFYQADFDGYFPALSMAASNQRLYAAPAVYGTSWLTSNLASFLTAEQGRVGLVTVHRYPFNVCLTMVGAPTIPSLFTTTATTDYATTFAPFLPTVTAAGVKLRVAEMNSISCGGVAGVSDVFAAGLWSLDAMFQLASIGAAGVNLHTGARYAVFDFDTSGALQVRGLYYGMLLFSRATGHQGRLLPVTVSSALQVRAWATLGNDGATRIAVINEDLSQPAEVRLVIPSRAAASQWKLTAPTLDATTAITFGAQTFQGSVDGSPSGSAAGEPVSTQSGTFRLALAPGSAALIVAP